ncbi:cobyrinate a,c-diamide synthase [Janibacter endophyticus]|uniref:cobyrinate a,c-diamide synthase n=1 Tax=Janibacter endophyticus TaxID=2806261 RepID=UPI0027DCB60B|nr:cobyrinate a,c-diamide synthase [Janibacter endophyticus]
MRIPRLLVAAPASGHGKTTITVGVMAALARRGLTVAPAKVGPDYIDPGYHALATGRPSRNLDPWLVGEDQVAPLLLRGATHPTPADVCLVEGVMGLLDGRLGGDGFASSAHVAALTSTPVLLVVDISSTSRTVAATVAGMAAYDEALDVVGVVLNKAGTARHADEARRAVEQTGVPVWGVVPRDVGMHVPSRHLGLVPAAESGEAAATLGRIADLAEEHVHLDAVLAAAGGAPDLDARPWCPSAALGEAARETGPGAPVVAVAGGRAFTFRYPETEELLTAAGCRVALLDPARDLALPPGTRALYVGGGFPEVHARALASNTSLLDDIRAAVGAGMPTTAECAGLLYLARSLDGHPMAGLVPTDAAMGPRLTLGYREAELLADSVLGPAGTRVSGHEFHRTVTQPPAAPAARRGEAPAWSLGGRAEGFALDPAGTGRATLVASYLHTSWAGSPGMAAAFAEAAWGHEGHTAAATATEAPVVPLGRPVGAGVAPVPVQGEPADGVDLDHHGDAETGDGLVDLAVNVRLDAPPPWLATALRDEVGRLAAYPDPAPARDALARRHDRRREEVLPTSGGAEAFTLLARALPVRDAVVVHPQFTEPEAALVAAGRPVRRVLLRPEDGFALTPQSLGEVGDADLVVLGNPTNPTGVLHPARVLRSLVRPGRVVVVDEAFMDAVPGEGESLLAGDLGGLLVVRSLTKTWGVAGVRAGYVAGDPRLVAALAAHQPHWSVGSLALRVMVETATPRALAEAARGASELQSWRQHLTAGLRTLDVPVVGSSAPFVLARPGPGAHATLRERGWALRRCDTFPGLDASWVRVAARDPLTTDGLLRELSRITRRTA